VHRRGAGCVSHGEERRDDRGHPRGDRREVRIVIARAAGLVLAAWLALSPAAAGAHGGGHGGAASLGPLAAVTVDHYRLELLTHSGPLERHRDNRVAVSITDARSGAAVSGATVLLGFAAPGGVRATEPATEETWAGHYAVSAHPRRTGAHRVLVTLAAADGRALEPPLTAEFAVDVGQAAGLGAWTWALLIGLAAVTAAALWWQAARARHRVAASGNLDLLSIPWLARAVVWRGWPWMLQVPMFVLMAAVVFLGFADVADGSRSLATRLTWTLWWAGIIFTFALVGRVWCVACPFGALNEWSSRLAQPSRRLPAPFRNIWWATGLFVLLTWADEQLGVVRSPRFTAWLVLALAALAVAVGLLFERRSFCRYLCPIGGVIGLYAMTAPVAIRAREAAVCRSDPDKGCYRPTSHALGCPMFEFPASMDRNTYCTLCAECLRGCGRANLALRVRAFGTDLWTSTRRALDEAYLAVVLVGLTLLVTAQMLPGWSAVAATLGGWLPSVVRQHLKPMTYLAMIDSTLLLAGSLAVAPLLLAAASVWSRRLAGPRAAGFRRTFVTFAYMLVPVGLGLHLAHNVGHLLLEGGGVVAALQRAVGVFTPWSLGEPDWAALALAPPPVVLVAQVGILVLLFALSLRAGCRLSLGLYPDAALAARAAVPMTLLALGFTVLGIVLLAQPMGLRHGM
jgi:polyferredoxin